MSMVMSHQRPAPKFEVAFPNHPNHQNIEGTQIFIHYDTNSHKPKQLTAGFKANYDLFVHFIPAP